MNRRRGSVPSILLLAAAMLPVVAACGSSAPAATPTPAPAATQPAAAAMSPGVILEGTTVTIVGQGRSQSDPFTLPAGEATMTITACRSNQVMPFITLNDATGQSAGLIVDPVKVLKSLKGGSYTVSAQANPDCVWQVVITPAASTPAASTPAAS